MVDLFGKIWEDLGRIMPNQRDIIITAEMLNMISEIERFNGAWNGGAFRLTPEELNGMKRIATIESVGSSNRIEGNKLSDAEVETLFEQIDRKSFRSRDEEEVAGYRDLVRTIFENYKEIPLTENYIKQMHQILLRYSAKDERHRGEYKQYSNRVAAFDAEGHEIGSIFETAPPFETPRLMRELVEWTNEALRDGLLHPIVTIGLFIVHFLAIHPFTDGNGRLSRALTLLLMLRCRYSYMPYSSMEAIIEASKDAYYRALRGTQRTMGAERVNYEPWLSFFITSLVKQKRSLETAISDITQRHDDALSESARAVLSLFVHGISLKMSDILRHFPQSPETIRKTVQGLVKKGFLRKYGTTRSASYAINQQHNPQQ